MTALGIPQICEFLRAESVMGHKPSPRLNDREGFERRGSSRFLDVGNWLAQQSGQPCGDRLGRTRTVFGQLPSTISAERQCEGPISGDSRRAVLITTRSAFPESC